MTAVPIDANPPPGGWTTDDLDDLPPDGRRRELLDGVLIVSPSPTNIHQIIAMRLGVALEASCPTAYQVTQAVEVRINPRRSLIPDVLVITDDAAARRSYRYEPHEVLLAVEIVSNSTQAMDRFTKPALYAHAGIPHFWRIETDDGLTVHAFRLDPTGDVYVAAGEFTEVVDVTEPWPITVPIKQLTPRHLRAQ